LSLKAHLTALQISVLDAQNHGAAGLTGEEPVHQCSTGIADMELACRGWREANAHGEGWGFGIRCHTSMLSGQLEQDRPTVAAVLAHADKCG
jgi:hypothetical protein